MFNNKAEELRNKANMIEALGDIYETLDSKYKWDCMKYNPSDDEHDEAYFTPYDEDELNEWLKARSEAYKMVFEAIEKMAK